MESSLVFAGSALLTAGLSAAVINTFLRNVEAGEIRLVSWHTGRLHIYRGPCKALVVPLFTVSRTIPAEAINVDIEITDQTADVDARGVPAPVKVTVQASAIVSVGESDAMVHTCANKFFSKDDDEQLNILTDVLSSAGRRAINLLEHDQLFNIRSCEGEDELAIIIKEACSRELLDLGLTFNSLNIKAVLSEVAEARRRESAARARASAEVVQLESQQRVNDQERELKVQVAANAVSIAKAETERLAAAQTQRRAELEATLLTQARADAEQRVLAADAEARAIRAKAEALSTAPDRYLELERLRLAPQLTAQIAAALKDAEFVNLGGAGEGAIAGASSDVLRTVQMLVAAKAVAKTT